MTVADTSSAAGRPVPGRQPGHEKGFVAIAIAIVATLLLPAAAQASTESFMAHNPALRADYAYAVRYWGQNPVGTTCESAEVIVTNWPWPPGVLGETLRGPKFGGSAPYCEVKIRYGIGRCRRRISVIHEMGHMLGLRFNPHPREQPEHSLDPHSVMFPAASVVWAEHPELCPWATPPPLPPNLEEWIEAEEEWS